MCRSTADGGQRCASHTRARYEAADPADGNAWNKAAGEYASTTEGAQRLTAEAAEAVAAQDWKREARLLMAVARGKSIRAANQETAQAVRTATTTPDTGSWQSGSLIPGIAHPSAHPSMGADRLRTEITNIETKLAEQENISGVHSDLRARRNFARTALAHREADDAAADAHTQALVDDYGQGPVQDMTPAQVLDFLQYASLDRNVRDARDASN